MRNRSLYQLPAVFVVFALLASWLEQTKSTVVRKEILDWLAPLVLQRFVVVSGTLRQH